MKPSPGSFNNQLTMAITELDFGGAEQAFVRIAKGLKTRGWDVRVISMRDAGPLAKPLREAGIPVEALNCTGGGDFRAVGRMKAALLKHPPSVLLTFLHQANIVGRLAARRASVKTVVCGVRVADRRWAVRIPEAFTRNQVSHYVAVSQSVIGVHSKLCGIAPQQSSVIYNGVDLAGFDAAAPASRTDLRCSPDDRIILCVGRLSHQKAPLDVVKAFERLRQLDPQGHAHRKLVFVGDGILKPAIERLVHKKKLDGHVHLLGWRSDVASLMKAANVLVLASKWEGLPNVILEAQAAGLPVIATDVDGCQEVVEDGKTGRLFPPGDTKVLAGMLLEFLGSQNGATVTQQKSLSSLAQNARAFAAQFTWEKCVGDYDALLRKLQSADSATSPPSRQ